MDTINTEILFETESVNLQKSVLRVGRMAEEENLQKLDVMASLIGGAAAAIASHQEKNEDFMKLIIKHFQETKTLIDQGFIN